MTASPDSLLDRLALHAGQRPNVVAYRDAASGAQLTWAELHRLVLGSSAMLRKLLPSGSVVMVVCPNLIEFPVIFLALMRGGFGALMVTPDNSYEELSHLARRSNAVATIGFEKRFDDFAPVERNISIDVFQNCDKLECGDLPGGSPQSVGHLLLLSSGSTGLPKIVVRSGQSVDAVCRQMVTSIGFTHADQVLATVPLCHSYGIEHGLLAPVYAGATTHLCRGLDWPTVLRELADRNITVLPAVPSVFEMLAELGSTIDCLPSLRAAYSAGGPLPVGVGKKFEARFGVPVGQVYGATEIGSVTYSDARSPTFNRASVGAAMPGVRVRTDGQVWVLAPSMFEGYLDVVESPTVDGFYPTGDLGEFDAHGNLCLTGRLKLLLEIGGLKVNPLEVEDVLRQHPGVADCVVVPVRQTETILRLKAIVTEREQSEPLSFAELRAFARQRLASYKVPRMFELRENLPRSAAGKIQRHLVQT